MALNDILKHMPGMDAGFSCYEPSEEVDFMGMSDYKVLTAPPFSNVSIDWLI